MWNQLKTVKQVPQFLSSSPLGQSLIPSQAGTHRPLVEHRNWPGQAVQHISRKWNPEEPWPMTQQLNRPNRCASRTHDRTGWRLCSAAEGPALWATPPTSWRPWLSWGAGGGARCTAAGLWYHTAWGRGLKSDVYTDYVSLRRQQEGSGGRPHRLETSCLNNHETSQADYSH